MGALTDLELIEVEELLTELSRYKYKHVKPKVERLQELLSPRITDARHRVTRSELGIVSKFDHIDIMKQLGATQSLLNGIKTIAQGAKDEITIYDRGTQDILHALELLDASEEELLSYATELKNLRQLRREAKNFIDLSKPMLNFINANKNTLKQFNEAIELMKDAKVRIDNKKYSPREMTALEVAFEQANIKEDKREAETV